MTRIPGTFRRLAKAGEAALIPYLPAGIPSLEVTRRLVPIIGRQGADLIMLGTTPGFLAPEGSSEPVARALLADCLSIAAEARRSNEVPLVLLAHRADIHEYGAGQLAADCAAAGVDALYVPDVPAAELVVACIEAGIDLVFPVSTGAVELPDEAASGFVVCPADDVDGVAPVVAQIRSQSDLPVVAQHMNATPGDVAGLSLAADGVLVGGSLLRVMEGAQEDELMLDVSEVVRSLKEATRKAAPTR
jgi:tryptophan synthase alpha chain